MFGQILPAIRYINLCNNYRATYSDIPCISCSLGMWHVRTSVVYFYIFLCIKIYVYIFQILQVACQTLGFHCWKFRPDESSYPFYGDIQYISLPILRYSLCIDQSLQVACENCCSYCEQSCHNSSNSRIVDSLSRHLGSSARVVYIHTYVYM